MITFEDLGIPLCHQNISPADTATGLSSACYYYTRYRLYFTDGDTELTANSWIVGATSKAVARIVSVHADTATWTNNTGYLIVDSWNKIAFSDTEEIKQGAAATAANVSGILKSIEEEYPFKGMQAKAVRLDITGDIQLINLTGATPNQTALIGIKLYASSTAQSLIILRNIDEIRNFKTMDYETGHEGTVRATFYF